jgi:serine/threonine protein kinase
MSGTGDHNDGPADDTTGPAGSNSTRDPGSVAPDDPNVGEVYGDRYRLDQQIGVGGMGVVYRATHLGLDRDVVVKLLSRDRVDDQAAVQRFEREARTLSRLDHPNIVTVFDFGYREDIGYIVMEFVDGLQLDELVQRDGPLRPPRLLPIAAQILDAIGQAHREGLVHRDLKPSNLMLAERPAAPPDVKILDFGLAKLVSGENDVTREDSLVGSMPYLSPEQIRGDDIDQRVDVYALGIVLYYALAGRKPFRGSNASILRDQVHSEPPPLPLHVPDPDAVPDGLFDLVARCLEKNPDDRFTDAGAALEQLEAIAARHRAVRMPETTLTTAAASSPRRPDASTDDAPSSAELFGKTSDTSDHLEVHRRRSTHDADDGPEDDPTENLTDPDYDGAYVDESGSLAGTAITAVSCLVVVIGTAALVAPEWFSGLFDSPEPTRIAPESSADAGHDAPPQMVLDQLERVDELARQDRVDEADALLVSLISTYDDADELDDKISARQKTIHLTRQYLEAREAEKQDDIDRAIDRYENITDRAPSFRDARKRLDRLESLARLRVETVEGAELRVDGRTVGESPVTTWVEPGRYEVTIEPEDDPQSAWSELLSVDEGEAVSLEPEL